MAALRKSRHHRHRSGRKSSIATSAINSGSSQQRLLVQILSMSGMDKDNAIDAKELQKHDEALLVELQKLGLKIDEADDDT